MTKASHQPFQWTEAKLQALMVRIFFQRAVLAVPCCNWTGHEADLLVVTKDLRLIDVEVKISRADLKADLKKDKWWNRRPWSRTRWQGRPVTPTRLEWPPKIWKHYYLMPEAIWQPGLEQDLPAASGIVLAREAGYVYAKRRAKPNRDAQQLNAGDAIDLARLAGLRMWDAVLRLQDGKGI